MTAYNPPDFQFSGLIFNPLIYEQGEASSSSSNTFTDLTTDNLYTNNIQGKTPSSNITLYTLTSGIVSLGGSLLNGIFSYATAHYWYSQAGSQLFGLRFNLYATNTISTDLYADTTAGTPATISIRASPSVLGDSTFANGIYSIFAGTTRLLNLISTSLEAPIHYLYNTAQTQKKQLVYGASTITESYFCDTTQTTISTANATISPFAIGNTTINNGNFAITSGSFQAISNRFTQMESVRHNLYNVAKTLYKSVFYGASTTINEEFYANSSNPTIATATTLIAPIGGTPTIANTGTYKITSGTTTLESSVAINLGTTMGASGVINVGSTAMSVLNINKPLTPTYAYNATTGAGTTSDIGYIYRSNTPASFSLATNDAFYNCQQITLTDIGVYMIMVDNKLYNNNSTGGPIGIFYMRSSLGTVLGGSTIFAGYFNAYAELANAASPNSQIDSPYTIPYVNTTAGQVLYTTIRVGRSALGLFWDSASFIRAVRIA